MGCVKAIVVIKMTSVVGCVAFNAVDDDPIMDKKDAGKVAVTVDSKLVEDAILTNKVLSVVPVMALNTHGADTAILSNETMSIGSNS